MASIRPITVYGEPVLHRRAAEVEVIDDEIRELIEDMYVTQDAAHGVGLAAPQVGVGLRIFTWTFPDSGDAPNVGHVINPVLTHLDKAPREDPHPDEHTEGCLSVPGLGFPLQRPTRVRLSGQRVDGEMFEFEAEGWFARIMQHEYDHLNGFLYVDRLNEKWKKKARKAIKAEGWGAPGSTWTPGEGPDPFGHDDPDLEDEHLDDE